MEDKIVDEPVTESPSVLTADKVLEDAKGKFTNVVVLGIRENGSIDLPTNIPQYMPLQYWLNKASFELFVHENSNNQKEVTNVAG